MEIDPTVWRKYKNKIFQMWWIIMMVKSTLKHFGFIKPSFGLYEGENFLFEQWWMFLLKGEEKVYIEKDSFRILCFSIFSIGICVCVYMHMYIWVCIFINVSKYVYACVCVSMYVHIFE